MPDLYAVIREGTSPELDLDLPAAINSLLAGAGHRWEIRKHNGLYSLWVTRRSADAEGGDGGFIEWPDCWGLTEQIVMNRLIGFKFKGAELLPMTMVLERDL